MTLCRDVRSVFERWLSILVSGLVDHFVESRSAILVRMTEVRRFLSFVLGRGHVLVWISIVVQEFD